MFCHATAKYSFKVNKLEQLESLTTFLFSKIMRNSNCLCNYVPLFQNVSVVFFKLSHHLFTRIVNPRAVKGGDQHPHKAPQSTHIKKLVTPHQHSKNHRFLDSFCRPYDLYEECYAAR